MKKKPEDYLKEPYARILIPEEDGTFSAEILEFPGCFAEGQTANEAIANLESAAMSWTEAVLDQGHEVPEPSISQGYGGKIALRLPRSIHRRAVELAARDNTSLNQFILSAVAARIGAEDLLSALVKKLEKKLAGTTTNISSRITVGVPTNRESLPDLKLNDLVFQDLNSLSVDAATINHEKQLVAHKNRLGKRRKSTR